MATASVGSLSWSAAILLGPPSGLRVTSARPGSSPPIRGRRRSRDQSDSPSSGDSQDGPGKSRALWRSRAEKDRMERLGESRILPTGSRSGCVLLAATDCGAERFRPYRE